MVSKVRENFSVINKTKRNWKYFCFQRFKDNLPTAEQYGDAIQFTIRWWWERELPIEYAAVIMDKIGCITQYVLNHYSEVKLCEAKAKEKIY